jgi:hypothetical protein
MDSIAGICIIVTLILFGYSLGYDRGLLRAKEIVKEKAQEAGIDTEAWD